MKQLLLITGFLLWFVGATIAINSYQEHQATTAHVTQIKVDSANQQITSLETSETQLCIFAKDAQTQLAKNKIIVTLPSQCS